jgi:hypothetical protein
MYEGRTNVGKGTVLGHENLGRVEEVGNAVDTVKVGDYVCLPFNIGCGFCANCERGLTGFCLTCAEPGSAGAPSSNVEAFFAKLMVFTKKLNAEEKRGLAEQLSEEELVIFDLLTKPEITLTKLEISEVKKVARLLLEKLEQEKLVLDWRKQQTTRAMVVVTIQDILNELPRVYTKVLYDQKCDKVYQHFYESYMGQGKSVYAVNCRFPALQSDAGRPGPA